MKIGERIRKVRLEKGMKQEELAERINVAQKKMSQIENDKSKLDVTLLKKISEELGVSLQELLPKKTYYHYEHCNQGNFVSGQFHCTNNFNPIEEIKNLYERLLKEQKEKHELEIYVLKIEK